MLQECAPVMMLRKKGLGSNRVHLNFPVTTLPGECRSTMAGAIAIAMSHSM